jgi:hypothetical protein
VDVDEHAGAVDVAELEVEGFRHAQPQGVDRPEVGLIVQGMGGVDHAVDFLAAQHVGQGVGARDAEVLEQRPVARHDTAVEEADAVEGLSEGGSRPLLLVLEVEEVLAQLGFADLVGRASDVLGEQADRTQVGFLGALAEAGDLQVGAHLLAQTCGGAARGAGAHERLLSRGVEE